MANAGPDDNSRCGHLMVLSDDHMYLSSWVFSVVCCDVNAYLLSDGSVSFEYRISNTEPSLTFKLVMGTRLNLQSFTVYMLFVACRPKSGYI